MKVLSFRDLMLHPDLKGYREAELIHPDMDDTMAKVLSELGMDTEYPVLYVPSKHRDLQGKVGVGFQCVGSVSLNRNFLDSQLADMTDKMVAYAHSDPSMAMELSSLSAGAIKFNSFIEGGSLVEDDNEDVVGHDRSPEYFEPDYELISKQIGDLTAFRDLIRGDPYNEAGDYKTYAEYKKARV